ncbi:mucin-5AC isoform X5 [Drosophila hydei]|uniref:chitinase n=1 Tax=Drosophila hydei TaxID=7224 RepID=A0A6J1MI05_DROHY|nr:mucin-5AC isoform X5 [Drosophila hydei]
MLPFRPGAAWQTLLLLCALAYCMNVASGEGRVVCYYTNWSVYRPGTAKFNPQNINPYLCTHLVYAFGGFTKDNQMKPFDKYQDIEQGGYAKFTGLKTYNKQLKTMIAIGGWNEASSRFSPLVASADRRQQFIKNILKFLRQNHFDGIDLDWEYPAHREGGKSRDRDNYAQFVQELRAEFEREAEKTGRSRLLLTMAVPAGIEYIDKGYDVPKLNKYLDWFNVLTYDFHSSHEPSVNHHAPLYSLEDDSEYNYDAELNIDYSIKYYLKAGADRDKLVLGIPTYGRSYTLINEESTELGAPSEGPGEQGDATREKGYLAYYEICQALKEDSEWTVVQPNANVMGPYAYRRNQWVGYDDEAIVRKKAEYVVAHGLGGIMFWAIDNDDFRGTCSGKPYPLIEAAKEAMFEAYGLGINEVAKSVGPQKPLRSRSRENGISGSRKHLSSESEASTRGSSATRRPASRGSTTTTPATTTFKLTEPKGSSLYIGGRGLTTPAPPTTPDPGSDFKCEEEGFFQHPRDCKKYYWCLDSGPSGLGIVAHQFTCPSGLYFNPAADSCDFARNVPCKTKKSTTAAPVTSTTSTTTTTQRATSSYNRVTAAPVARPVYPRVTSTSSTTTTTTTTASPVEEELEYEEEVDNAQTSSKSSDAEEDPQVIKELIDLIRKVGGIEQLEKHLLRNKDGSITLKENFSSGAPTTPSTISKSLYDRVLNRPETLGTFSRNRFNAVKVQSTETTVAEDSSSQVGNSKYSSVLRGNSRQGPQNEGLEKLAEFDGFLKERKQYVTINRNRVATRDDEEGEVSSRDETEASEEEEDERFHTTRRPISSATPSYTSLRRSRPTTTTSATPVESVTELEQTFASREQTQTKQYATLSRNRGRTTERPQSTASEPEVSSITNRYKYLERTRPTKSSADVTVGIDASEHDAEEDEDEYEDEPQQKNDKETGTLSLTTQSPPPATTLLHVFTLVEGEAEEEQEPTGRPLGSKTTAVEPKHKLIEINRIVEINSKQAKAAQRKSKANQDFGTLRVESLPHVEQLGEISVVKYVHLVDGSDIQINDGHSTVADYTPTEPSVAKSSAPVRNSLPQSEGDSEPERNGKSLLPEVIRGAFETSTISLEGLFDSERKAKQLSFNSIGQESNTENQLDVELDTINSTELPTVAPALPTLTYVRPIVPLLRPESNESSPLIISIANLDKVILSKVQAPEGESDASAAAANGIDDSSSSTLLPPTSSAEHATDIPSDSNSAFSVRHASVLQAPIDNRLTDLHKQTTNYTLDTNGAISGIDNNNNNNINNNNNSSNNNMNNMNNIHTATTLTNSSSISEKISYSTETHVVRRKKSRRGRGRRLRQRHNATTTTTTATTTTTTATTTLAP